MSGNATQAEPPTYDVAGAQQEFERASAVEDPEALYQIGFVLEAHGDSKGAESAFRKADDLRHAEAPVELARYLYNYGNGERADYIAAYKRADQRGSAQGAYCLGCLLQNDSSNLLAFPAAWRAFTRADQREHPDAPAHLGLIKQRLGFLPAAIADFQRAEGRGSATAAIHLGAALYKRGDVDGALDAYWRAADSDNQASSIWAAYDLAQIYTIKRDISQAVTLYEYVLEKQDPHFAPYAAVRLGERCDPKDTTRAQTLYDIACSGDSYCISAGHYNFGLVLMTAREFDQALPYLEVACGFRKYPLSEEFLRSGSANRAPQVTREMLLDACMAGSTHAAARLEEIAAQCRHPRKEDTSGFFTRRQSCGDCGTTWSGVEAPGTYMYPGGVYWTEHNPKADWWLYMTGMARDRAFPPPARQSSRNTTSAGKLTLRGPTGAALT